MNGIGPGTVPFHGCTPPSIACLGFGIVTAPWPDTLATILTTNTTEYKFWNHII